MCHWHCYLMLLCIRCCGGKLGDGSLLIWVPVAVERGDRQVYDGKEVNLTSSGLVVRCH